jgi:curved DNA-binding protein
LEVARDCNPKEIRDAFRRLSRRHHPDTNGGSEESVARTQAINAAHAVLRDPARRRAYDEDLLIAEDAAQPASVSAPRPAGRLKPLTRDVRLTVEELLRGIHLSFDVQDPASGGGSGTYRLDIPAGTAAKSRFKVPCDSPDGALLVVTIGLRPHPRFKARGSDLRCDHRISPQRALAGGSETLTGPDGGALPFQVPAGAGRGEIVRLPGQGLPRPRGGRGDLLVRLVYRPEVRVRFQKKA